MKTDAFNSVKVRQWKIFGKAYDNKTLIWVSERESSSTEFNI